MPPPYGFHTTGQAVADDFAEQIKAKTFLITGGTAGLGLETAITVLSQGGRAIITGRSDRTIGAAISKIKERVPTADDSVVKGVVCDLSDLASVRDSVTTISSIGWPLEYVMANAGVMACPLSRTAENLELQFATNHIGHFLLIVLLLPLIKASKSPRIVVLSSIGHYLFSPPDGILFDDMDASRRYDEWQRYGISKLANVLFAQELQRRLDAGGRGDIIVTSAHPGGIMETDLKRHMGFWTTLRMMSHCRVYNWDVLRTKNTQEGISTALLCLLRPDVEKGEYYSDCAVETRLRHERVGDAALAKRLWEFSERISGVRL